MTPEAVNPEDFVDVASFHTKDEVRHLETTLKSRGVEVQIKDERNLQRFWFMAPQKAGIHVQVRRKEFEQTKQILDEQAHGAQQAIHCPSCDSTRVQYPALTRKNVLPALVGWLLVVLHLTEHKYYCEDCHYTWPNRKEDVRPTEILQ